MIRLQTLGAVDLRRDDVEVRSVLLQPKRLALLVYLAAARPRGFHSRDTLLGLFWPESDDDRARNALRQALHWLRRSLGPDAVESRGDREVGVRPEVLWSDAAAFDDALEEGRLEDALALYRGDFMPGFFIEDAPEAERWLEEERGRRRRAAVEAAWGLARREEELGRLRAASVWSRRAAALVPTDETALRRLLETLERAGERAAAVEAFTEFEARLRAELGVAPSADVRRLAERLRQAPLPDDIAPPAPAVLRAVRPPLAPEPPPTRPAPAGMGPPLARAPLPVLGSHCVPGDVVGGARAASPSPRAGWTRWVAAATVVLTLALGGWGVGQVRARAHSPGTPSMAVLPFVSLSPEEGSEYFTDGITEEVLARLARLDGLRLASRSSSFAFKGQSPDVRDVGSRLGVATVLEGTVRRDGERVKIIARLVNARTGYQLWSETYERRMADLFTVQEDIARAIADALELQLRGPGQRTAGRPTSDTEAYDLYLRGRHLAGPRSEEGNRKAIDYLEEAVERDPGFALAHAALARALLAMSEFVPPRQVLPRAKEAALRALDLDSTLVETRLALAAVRQVWDRDWEAAEEEVRRAIRLDPASAGAYFALSDLLVNARRFGEARQARLRAWEIRRAETPDSLMPTFRAEEERSWGSFELHVGDGAAAERHARASLELDPSSPYAHSLLALVHLVAGRTEEGVAEAEEARARSPRLNYLTQLGYAYARAGRVDEARAILDSLQYRDRTQYVPKDQIALVNLGLGHRDAALDWLERAVEDYHWWLPNANAHPIWADLQPEPRFQTLMRTLGAPAPATAPPPG